MTTRRLRLLRAGLAAAAGLAGLAAAEWVARRAYGPGFLSLVDPYEHHPYRPYAEYTDQAGNRVTTNALGWKDRAERRQVAHDPRPARRVVLLGDSFTEGLGLPAEQTAAAFAEAALDRPGRPVEVLNGGRVSYSPLLEHQRLKRFLARGYRADVVVVLPDVSDVQDEIGYTAQFELAADGEPLRLRGGEYGPVVRAVYNHSALARWARRAQLRLADRLPPAEVAHSGRAVALTAPEVARLAAPGPLPLAEYERLSPAARAVLRHAWVDHPPSRDGWAAEGLRLVRDRIARIERLARSHGMRTVVVAYPWPPLLYTREDPARYAHLASVFPLWFSEREQVLGRRPSDGAAAYRLALQDVCRERAIPLVDLFPVFAAEAEWERLFVPGDVHWSAAGARLAGEAIARAVEGELDAAVER
jgi:lysophospholipase L1-like esterase